MICVRFSSKSRVFLSLHPNHIWDQDSFSHSVFQVLFPQQWIGRDMKLTIHRCLVPRLIMHGDIPTYPYLPIPTHKSCVLLLLFHYNQRVAVSFQLPSAYCSIVNDSQVHWCSLWGSNWEYKAGHSKGINLGSGHVYDRSSVLDCHGSVNCY
jgi:hypothetical protein